MARCKMNLARRLVSLLDDMRMPNGTYEIPNGVSGAALLKLALEVGADDLTFFEHIDQLVWAVARHEGYVIPDYPMDSNSEVRAFLAEYGAETVEDWYRLRGVTDAVLAEDWRHAGLMARNVPFWRKIVPASKEDLDNPARVAGPIRDALAFCLSATTGEDDARLFSV